MLCVDRESWFIFAACRYVYGNVPGTWWAMVEISIEVSGAALPRPLD